MQNDDLTPAMKGSVREIVREELTGYATRDETRQMMQQELAKYATKDDMWAMGRRLNEGIDQVLTVVINIEKYLKGKVDNHERRIKKLEDHTGLALTA